MQLLSGLLPRAARGPEHSRDEDAEGGDDVGAVRTWKVRLRPRRFGRAVVAKAKPVPEPVPPMAPASSHERPTPSGPMMSLSGHPLPSLKRLPSRRLGSSTDLL